MIGANFEVGSEGLKLRKGGKCIGTVPEGTIILDWAYSTTHVYLLTDKGPHYIQYGRGGE